MLGRVHFALTLYLSFLLFTLLGGSVLESIVLASIVASLSTIPDYDWKIYSWANKKYLIFERNKILKVILFPYYLFILFLIKVFRHRTTTHSIFFPMALMIVGRIVHIIGLSQLLFLSGIASLFHIVEDAFTVSGVPLFYPISKKNYKIPLVNTRRDQLKQKILEVGSYALLILTIVKLLS